MVAARSAAGLRQDAAATKMHALRASYSRRRFGGPAAANWEHVRLWAIPVDRLVNRDAHGTPVVNVNEIELQNQYKPPLALNETYFSSLAET